MRIHNYPTDVLTGTEQFLASNFNTVTQEYETVNFTVDTLKTFLVGTDDTNEFTNITLGGSLKFEGSSADAHETTLGVINPDADRAINLPNASGTIALTSNLSAYLPLAGGTMTGNLVISNTSPIITFTDTTGSAKSGKIKVDSDSLTIRGDSDNELVSFPLGSTNTIQFSKPIVVDASITTASELNKTDIYGDFTFKTENKHLIVPVLNSGNYANSSNTVGTIEMQFHNTNANGTDDRLVRLVPSTGAGGSGDWGGRLFIYTRVNGGNTFKSFKFDDTGAFSADKIDTDNIELGASVSGSVDLADANPAVTVNGTSGQIQVTTDGTIAAGASASKRITVTCNGVANGGAVIMLTQQSPLSGTMTMGIPMSVQAGSFKLLVRNVANANLNNDTVITYNFAVINRP